MQTTHLLNFVAVIETGSVRAAAKRLGVSPAAISKNLSALERKLGVTLLSRSARGAEPNDFGRSLLRRARVIEAELDRARDDIAALIGQRRGSVSIGISPTAECLLLPRALPRFRETYADIPVRMMGGTVSSTIKALREAALDFAVGSASAFTHEPDLRKERLLNSEMTIIARPGHSLSKARALEELKDAEWVINAGVSDPDPATVVMFRPPREPWSPSFAKQRERFAADPNNRERQGAPRPPSILPHSCTGGVPWVWNDSIVFSPHAWPFLRSSSVHTIGFQSGARMRRAPALATSTRLPPGS
jgi:DNA-binding transcriptional LysR family regulator